MHFEVECAAWWNMLSHRKDLKKRPAHPTTECVIRGAGNGGKTDVDPVMFVWPRRHQVYPKTCSTWPLVVSCRWLILQLHILSHTMHPCRAQHRSVVRAKLHYTDTGYEHHQRTKICHIPTSWHVEMLGSGIAMWRICCRIVVNSSVGGDVRSRCPCSGVWHVRRSDAALDMDALCVTGCLIPASSRVLTVVFGLRQGETA